VRVRFVAPGRTAGGERRREHQGFQTVGNEYIVLAIKASNERGVRFLLLSDHPRQPGWHDASDYDLVSDEVPSNWVIDVGAAGRSDAITIAPATWLEPGFFEDYWSEDPVRGAAAQEIFKRELNVITKEIM
jgi:hypothetical protein